METRVQIESPKKAKLIRIARTANIYLSFFGLGLLCAIPGPTLLDLQRNVGIATKHIAFIYSSRSSGIVLGSIAGGFLFDRFNRQTVFVLVISISAIVNFAIPWWGHFAPLAICMFISGLVLGALDTGGNVWVLDMWKERSAPFMQALHFTFGLGAFAAPLVAEPFLSPSTQDIQVNLINETVPEMLNSTEIPTEIDGFYIINAYAIISVYVFLVSLSFLLVGLINPQDVPRHTVNSERETETTLAFKYGILTLAIIFLFLFCGVEMSYGQMLTTFAVKSDLKLSKNIGSFMTSVYWGTYMVARGMGILWATKFTPFSMLVVNLVLINVAGIMLVSFGNSVVEILWIGTAILGLGVSTMYASLFAWIERYVQVSNKVASMFVVAGSIGEMVTPLAVGYYTESYPPVLLYISCGICVTCFVAFIIMCKIASVGRDRYSVGKSSEDSNGKVEEVPLNSKIKLGNCESEEL